MACANAISGTKRLRFCETNAVEHGAVLAAAIADGPLLAISLNGQMLTGKPGVFGVEQFIGAGAAERYGIVIEWDGPGRSVGGRNHQLPHFGLFAGAKHAPSLVHEARRF